MAWNVVSCNDNGGILYDVKSTTTFSKATTSTTAAEISATLSAGVSFVTKSLGVKVSQSLAAAWTRTGARSEMVRVTCDFHDSGAEFRGGCMWRVGVVVRRSWDEADWVEWNPLFVKCTSGVEAPRCPPFTKCANDECSLCEDDEEGLNTQNEDE